MLKLIKRACLWFAIFEQEIVINGHNSSLELVSDPAYRHRIEVSRSNHRDELTRLRGLYNETLPPGKRVTWSMA